MQVGIDVKYVHTNFGECGLSGFGDIATFKNDFGGHGLFSFFSFVVVGVLH